MIEVRNLVKKYGDHLAVDHLSFVVEAGQIYGFLGPNGAGKSTTMNILTGCLAATSGEVLIDGHDIYKDAKKAKACIGYLPEIPPLYPDMTADEYLTFVAELKGVSRKERPDAVESVMNKTGLLEVRNRLIKNLSKGYKQRVGLAQAILGNPKVIILDEPTVGLDPAQIIEIRNVIKSLAEDHTVIFSSHILSEVSEICNRIMIISGGTLVAEDTPENLESRFMTNTVLKISVKGEMDDVSSVLDNIDDILEYEISDPDEFGKIYLEVTTEKGSDITEEIAVGFSENGCILLGLEEEKVSLEDVFMELISQDQAAKLDAMEEAEFEEISVEDLTDGNMQSEYDKYGAFNEPESDEPDQSEEEEVEDDDSDL